jgi:delta 1-pyrroline-5-carboxylate dehydrogenase
LVGALIGVQLFGFIGIVIAAPVVASLALLLHYVINKLNDQNPWKDYELQKIRNKSKIVIFLQQSWEKFNTWIGQKYKQIRARFSKADSKSSTSDTDHATSVEEK